MPYFLTFLFFAWGLPLDDRTHTISTAIAEEAETPREAFQVAAVFAGESRLAERVHDGTKRGDGGRSVCLGQLHKRARVTVHPHSTLAGTDLPATRRCAAATLEILRRWNCATLEGKFNGYGTGKACRPYRPFAIKRARRVRRALSLWRSGGNQLVR